VQNYRWHHIVHPGIRFFDMPDMEHMVIVSVALYFTAVLNRVITSVIVPL
jgi:hypothetical protein